MTKLVGPNISRWAGEGLQAITLDRLAERTLYDRRVLPEQPYEFRRGFVDSITCEADHRT